jgi:hypothetical protein
MQTSSQFARALGERACLVAWMFLMVANTVMIGLSVELLVFGALLSLNQVTLIDGRTLPFLAVGFAAALNFPFVIKLHNLGVAHLNFEIHENILNNASESWATLISTLLNDETSLKSNQLEKMVRAIANAESAAVRQECRREAKAWLIENYESLPDEDKEVVHEQLGYLKLR